MNDAVEVDRVTLGCAIFAMGAFVQYRLDDGMHQDYLAVFMQAYLNLEAAAEGREPLDLRALQAQTVTATPEEQRAILTVFPSWLPDGEKLRHVREIPCNAPCTTGLDVPV
ncbi:MAG: hypothetical protein BWK73_26760 [Thiothrix lacustris]|uniref:Uncharacterized protein n=1 Tax=Thiothrix lacustris TaxID=525917 RepID=A0A1Y1QL20_9GAMM|nr:MAG: hypothetical protein BWK73_26760 [Thiothrix lacustris]